jgi:hypothetical protein
MDDERTDLLEQIERCRRIALLMTDDEMRRSLENLAHDYELQLRRMPSRSFMLRHR